MKVLISVSTNKQTHKQMDRWIDYSNPCEQMHNGYIYKATIQGKLLSIRLCIYSLGEQLSIE